MNERAAGADVDKLDLTDHFKRSNAAMLMMMTWYSVYTLDKVNVKKNTDKNNLMLGVCVCVCHASLRRVGARWWWWIDSCGRVGALFVGCRKRKEIKDNSKEARPVCKDLTLFVQLVEFSPNNFIWQNIFIKQSIVFLSRIIISVQLLVDRSRRYWGWEYKKVTTSK